MILAIDPGLTSCGWALFDDDRLVDAGVIITKAGDEGSVAETDTARARALLDLLVTQVKRNGATVESIYMEGFAAARAFRALRAQSIVIGVIGCLAWHLDAQISSVSPAKVKQIVQEAVDAARAPCKPLRQKIRDLEVVSSRSVTRAEKLAVDAQIKLVEKELAPLERARGRAEKDAIIAAAIALHPEVEPRMAVWGRRAEHVADAIAVYWAVRGAPPHVAAKPRERQGSLL